MREILFRGKRTVDGKWVESCCQLGEIHSGTVTHDFDSKTVCQYTGLIDRNGRKIFEGDIISKKVNIYRIGSMEPTGERMLVGTVIWDESSSIYPGEWSIKAQDEHGNDAVYIFDNGYKVIGNIFDNPNLIGKQVQTLTEAEATGQ